MRVNNQQYKGIVVALKANYLIVEISKNIPSNNGKKEIINTDIVRLLCTKRSRLSFKGHFVSVGDIVTIEAIDWNELKGVISSIEPRKSYINRPPVANFTDIFVVCSLREPMFEMKQTSRFLLKAEETGKEVTMILTKSDLIDKNKLYEYSNRLISWGYNPLPISIISGEGMNAFYKKLRSIKLGLLCGPSGVGKSSLINSLSSKINTPTGTLSQKLKRGKNTTRHVELFSVADGCFIADTPGFNKPEIRINPNKLASLFPEIRIQEETSHCKFRNCLHLDEPGCAISRNWERYEEYKHCLEDMINLHH